MSTPFVDECLAILTRTPTVMNALLRNLPDAWTTATEGAGTWSPYDVIGHLIHGEQSDWMVRIRIVLEEGPDRVFDPFDREAQFRDSAGKSLVDLLDQFAALRADNIDRLRALNLTEGQLAAVGTHPVLGTVAAREILATWTAHDLAHLVQVNRVMAKRYRQDVGPFATFLSVMK
jgi:hypothetical protein